MKQVERLFGSKSSMTHTTIYTTARMSSLQQDSVFQTLYNLVAIKFKRRLNDQQTGRPCFMILLCMAGLSLSYDLRLRLEST
jgi:hypothetical protein